MNQLRPGAVISRRELMTTRSQSIQLPDPTRVVHLQFRRYAGCPFCNLHLRAVAQRHQELVAAGIREVVVFASSPRAVLDPRAWLARVRAVARTRPSLPANRQQALGLPADFLVAADGQVLACKYGAHAYDQWSVDDLLHLASRHNRAIDHRLRT